MNVSKKILLKENPALKGGSEFSINKYNIIFKYAILCIYKFFLITKCKYIKINI